MPNAKFKNKKSSIWIWDCLVVIYKTFAEIQDLQLTNYRDFNTFDLGLRMLRQFKKLNGKIKVLKFELFILNSLTDPKSN